MIEDKWKGNKLERARFAILGFRELYSVRKPRLDRGKQDKHRFTEGNTLNMIGY